MLVAYQEIIGESHFLWILFYTDNMGPKPFNGVNIAGK